MKSTLYTLVAIAALGVAGTTPAYASSGGESLPARLTLQRDKVRVRLLVDTWQP